MLHRIVSRSVVAFAAVGLLASCEDNTTGTPLPPFTPSTAVYVNAVTPDGGYITENREVTLSDGSTIVAPAVTPNAQFQVLFPDGSPAVGQIINFNVNLPGLIQQSRDTVDADGFVSPGDWIVGRPCPPEENFCRPTQRVIATPAAGNTGFIDVTVDTLTPLPPIRTAGR